MRQRTSKGRSGNFEGWDCSHSERPYRLSPSGAVALPGSWARTRSLSSWWKQDLRITNCSVDNPELPKGRALNFKRTVSVVLAERLASPKLEIGAGIRPVQTAKTSLELPRTYTLVTLDP